MKKLTAVAIVAGAIFGAGCGGGNEEAERRPASPESEMRVEVTGYDFGYTLASETVPSGRLHMELTNKGKQPHQAMLYRLKEGVEMADFTAAVVDDDSTLPELATAEGGMTRYAGTGETVTTEGPVVEPGTYALVCFVRDQSLKTNKNHAELGMIAPLVVE